jgi:hypothetical protein
MLSGFSRLYEKRPAPPVIIILIYWALLIFRGSHSYYYIS